MHTKYYKNARFIENEQPCLQTSCSKWTLGGVETLERAGKVILELTILDVS